jgi:hypothetical protein
MSERTAESVLAGFKVADVQTSALHGAVMLCGNDQAQRVIAAWSFAPVEWNAPKGAPPADERQAWEWLWDGCKYDEKDLADRAGIARNAWPSVFKPLRGARLVFPDGTVSEHALKMLRTTIAGTISAPAKRARR